MSDPFYHYHPTPAIRWVERPTEAARMMSKGNVEFLEQSAGYAATEAVLQQLFVSDIVGEPAEWRDVPTVEES